MEGSCEVGESVELFISGLFLVRLRSTTRLLVIQGLCLYRRVSNVVYEDWAELTRCAPKGKMMRVSHDAHDARPASLIAYLGTARRLCTMTADEARILFDTRFEKTRIETTCFVQHCLCCIP